MGITESARERVRTLRAMAVEAGDQHLSKLCDAALAGNTFAQQSCLSRVGAEQIPTREVEVRCTGCSAYERPCRACGSRAQLLTARVDPLPQEIGGAAMSWYPSQEPGWIRTTVTGPMLAQWSGDESSRGSILNYTVCVRVES